MIANVKEIKKKKKNIEKEPQKPRPKLRKYVYYIFTGEYLLCLQSNACGSFLQKCVNFVGSNFFTLKVA